MSRYVTVKTEFRDQNALIDALMETGGWAREQIEVHQTPQNLFGHRGDKRKQKANIIIRKKHVGCSSNDIGFVNEDGSYKAIISVYDQRNYGPAWIGKLKGNYAFHKIRREQESRGRSVSRTRCPRTGKQKLEITGYR